MQKQFPIDHWLARERKKEWAKEIPSYRNRSNEMVIRGSRFTHYDCRLLLRTREKKKVMELHLYLWLDCVWHNTQSAKEINLIPAVVMQFWNSLSWAGSHFVAWWNASTFLIIFSAELFVANYTRHTTLDRKCHFWTRVGICILHLSMHLECPLFLRRPLWIAMPEEYNSQTVGCVGQFVTQKTEPLVHPVLVWHCSGHHQNHIKITHVRLLRLQQLQVHSDMFCWPLYCCISIQFIT